MTKAGHRSGPWIWSIAIIGLIALVVAWSLVPVQDWMETFRRWVGSLGGWGPAAFVAIYIVATVALAPASPLSVAAGLAFGAWGIPIVLVSATIGASLAFLTGRYLMRDSMRRLTERRPKFKAVDAAVKQESWKVVLLLRLSPLVPFNLQNYLFGATSIAFWPFVAATFVGIIPGAVLYVYLGIIGKAVVGGDAGGRLKWVFLVVGLIATVGVAVLITKRAREKLKASGLGRP